RQDLQGFCVDTLGVWASLNSETAVGTLTYGAEWYRDWVDSFSSSNPIQGPVADDATYDSVVIYLQDEIGIGERGSVILGVRYNYAATDAKSVSDPETGEQISIKDDWSALVGSLRGRYEFVEDRWSVFGGVSQGFRAPNLSDLTRFDSARTNEFEIPAPGLDPEDYTQFELGLKGACAGFRIETSVYYTLVRDQITRFLTGNTNSDGENEVTKGNLGDGYVWGFELGGEWDFHESWTLFGIFTYIEGKVDTFATSEPILTREYISRLMPASGNIGLRWRSTDDRFWAETIVQLAAKADRLSPRDESDTSRIPPGGTPGYAVWYLRGGWNINEKMQAILGLENLFDKSYRVHGSGHNMPGFNAVLTFSAAF
ncbi:MAG: TonB-dependent receptor, partial [Planctomycetota bacterium]